MLEKQGRFSLKDFSYDATADAYRCPAGELLRPTKGRFTNTSGRVEIRYLNRKAICGACPLKARCLAPKAPYRSIGRWEHQDVIERHRARMQSADADKLMSRRSAIVEHPFGTIKCRAGYRHFLLRGFDKVRGEWSLMALCYNFTRVLNILGFERFAACMAKLFRSLARALTVASTCIQLLLETFGTNMPVWLRIIRSAPILSGDYTTCPDPTGKSVNCLSSPFSKNILSSQITQINFRTPPSRPTQRGVSRSSRTLERDAVDASDAADESISPADGEVVWS